MDGLSLSWVTVDSWKNCFKHFQVPVVSVSHFYVQSSIFLLPLIVDETSVNHYSSRIRRVTYLKTW